jgi:enoyl-CoA hydratase/carnithine racemase
MEYGWQCFTGKSIEYLKKSSSRISLFSALAILVIALVLAVASFSYAEEALNMGLVNRIVPVDLLNEEANRLAVSKRSTSFVPSESR